MAEPPPDLIHRFRDVAARRATHIAVEAPEGRFTYGELDVLSNRLARHLMSLGVQRDSRVGISMSRGAAELVALLATAKAGGAYVPLDPAHPVERLRGIVDDAAPQVMVTQSGLPLAGSSNGKGHLLLLDDFIGASAHYDASPILSSFDPAQIAYILFTSGSTGRPKGVEISRGAFANFMGSMAHTPGMTEHEKLLAITTTSFDIAGLELFLPLWVGAAVSIADKETARDPRILRKRLEADRISIMQATPSTWRLLLEAGWRPNGRLRMLCGGEAMPRELANRLLSAGGELWNLYGPTETTVWSTIERIMPGTDRITIGRPIDRTQIYVLDERLAPVPTEAEGEIWIGGDGLARGYFGRPELTAERFVQNPRGAPGDRLYRTGDLGRKLGDGRFECLGRIDHQVKIRGFRIELGEIESALRQAPGVREAVVVARELSNQEPALVAYLVPDPGPAPDVKELRRFLQSKLPEYMVPAAFVSMQALPLNTNQKVDRKALPAPTPQDLVRSRTFVPPRNDVERQLVEIWQSVLGVSPIGIDDSFFDVGGNSLLALTLMMRVEQKLGKTLPLSTLLTEATIERLAAALTQADRARESLVLLRAGGSGVPVFFVHDGEGEVLPYRNLAMRLKPEHPVYGLQPSGLGESQILHTRVTQMVDFYAEQICRVQPHGPYLLGGLCVGGFLAFEIARKLRADGREVGMVALIDSAHVGAVPKSLASMRLLRFTESMTKNAEEPALMDRLSSMAKTATRKLRNLATYEIKTQSKRVRTYAQMMRLRRHLDRGEALPHDLQQIPVSTIIRFAEKEHESPGRYGGEVVLLRATQKDRSFDGTLVDDTPYIDLYTEPLLGWADRAARLKVHDHKGGHSSMLQEPNVAGLAERIQGYVDAAVAQSAATAAADGGAGVVGRAARAPSTVVVTVNYRCAPLTISALRAIEPEVRASPNVRAVVVENDSGDDSIDQITAAARTGGWDWLSIVESQHNGGYAYGNNAAIRPLMQGPNPPSYFLLLNPDTEARPGAIAALVDFMERNPEVGIAGSDLLNPDGSSWSTAFRFPTAIGELEAGVRLGLLTKFLDRWVVPMKMGDEPRQVDWVAGASFMIRREVLETVGMMDEQYFLYFEETDFCLRAWRAGWSCWYVPTSKVMHISGQSTGVTARNRPSGRRPQYLFDSRRRYFVKNHGLAYSAMADLAWSVGFASWRLRRVIQRKPDADPPLLLSDSLRNSVFLKGRAP